jgi:hypothetical protein
VAANTAQLSTIISSYRANREHKEVPPQTLPAELIVPSSASNEARVKVHPQPPNLTTRALIASTHDLLPTILIMADLQPAKSTNTADLASQAFMGKSGDQKPNPSLTYPLISSQRLDSGVSDLSCALYPTARGVVTAETTCLTSFVCEMIKLPSPQRSELRDCLKNASDQTPCSCGIPQSEERSQSVDIIRAPAEAPDATEAEFEPSEEEAKISDSFLMVDYLLQQDGMYL